MTFMFYWYWFILRHFACCCIRYDISAVLYWEMYKDSCQGCLSCWNRIQSLHLTNNYPDNYFGTKSKIQRGHDTFEWANCSATWETVASISLIQSNITFGACFCLRFNGQILTRSRLQIFNFHILCALTFVATIEIIYNSPDSRTSNIIPHKSKWI